MHPSVMEYVKERHDCHRFDGPVLEVGSFNVNGTPRTLFPGVEYTGVDMREGPGVDLVAEARDLPWGDGTFGTVVSTEMLEHDTRPWLSIAEMARVLRHNGHLLLTARGYDIRGCFPIHDYPADHWRFSVTAVEEMMEAAGLHVIDSRPDPTDPGVFCVARKFSPVSHWSAKGVAENGSAVRYWCTAPGVCSDRDDHDREAQRRDQVTSRRLHDWPVP